MNLLVFFIFFLGVMEGGLGYVVRVGQCSFSLRVAHPLGFINHWAVLSSQNDDNATIF
jgi:hypothetical protein